MHQQQQLVLSELVDPTSFANEIRDMLYAFGDSHQPNLDTAKAVEEVLRSQMGQVLIRASEASLMRDGTRHVIMLEDLLFLMRRNPIKIQRLIRYLSVKELAALATQDLSAEGTERGAKATRRLARCRQFLANMDVDGQLLLAGSQELDDPVLRQRLLRMDEMSRQLDHKRYLEYTRARQANFLASKGNKITPKFNDWLFACVRGHLSLQWKLEPFALEILSYIAYETVGHLVDMSLIVRDETTSCSNMAVLTDPIGLQSRSSDALNVSAGAVNGLKCGFRVPLKPQHVQEAVMRFRSMPQWNGTVKSVPLFAL